MGEMDQTNQQMKATVTELREKLAASGEQDPAAMKAAEQLRAQYRESVNEVKTLQSQVETLNTENQGFQVKISELTAARDAAMKVEPSDNMGAELTQKNQMLSEQNVSLTQQNQTLTEQNQALNQQNQTLVQENQMLGEKQQMAVGENQTLNDRIVELTNSNESQLSEIASLNSRPMETTTVAAPAVDVTPYESKIARLTRKNRELTKTNSEFEDRNLLLTQQLAGMDTEVEIEPVAAEPDYTATVAEPAVAAVPAVPKLGFDFSKYGVLGYLIPFFAIGLGVAFFVVMREELHKPPTTGSVVRDAVRSSDQSRHDKGNQGRHDKGNQGRRDNENRS